MSKSTDTNYKKTTYTKFICLFLVASVAVHIFFFFIHVKNFSFVTSKKIEENRPKKIKLKLKSFNRSNPKQIVNTAEKKPVKEPKEAKFLGRTNQHFERQTVSKNVNSYKTAGKGVRNGTNEIKKAKKGSKKSKKINKVLQKVARLKKKQKKSMSLKDLSLGSLSGSSTPDNQVEKKVKGTKFGENGKVGFASNNDYIEDLPLGDMSNLNTKEYKYYGFYHRIRQKLEQYWGDSLRKKAENFYKKGRRMPASENYITGVRITLNSQGEIVDVEIKNSSGISELDEAAIESFNRAGPFPNPPKGMIKNGHAQIEWGFVVKS